MRLQKNIGTQVRNICQYFLLKYVHTIALHDAFPDAIIIALQLRINDDC